MGPTLDILYTHTVQSHKLSVSVCFQVRLEIPLKKIPYCQALCPYAFHVSQKLTQIDTGHF